MTTPSDMPKSINKLRRDIIGKLIETDEEGKVLRQPLAHNVSELSVERAAKLWG